jgi:SET domain-containing protein
MISERGDICNLLASLEICTHCRLKPSKVHGVGVFAIKDIKKGQEPFPDAPEFSGLQVVPTKEIEKIDPEVKKVIMDFYSRDEEYYYIGPTPNNIGIYAYMNHSEKEWNIELSKNKRFFVAAKDIKKSEELLTNYKQYSKFENNFHSKEQ